MTARLDQAAEVIEAHDSVLRIAGVPAGAKYLRTVAADGTITLTPFAVLHPSEVALLEDGELLEQARRGLAALADGRGVSSDWLVTAPTPPGGRRQEDLRGR